MVFSRISQPCSVAFYNHRGAFPIIPPIHGGLILHRRERKKEGPRSLVDLGMLRHMTNLKMRHPRLWEPEYATSTPAS